MMYSVTDKIISPTKQKEYEPLLQSISSKKKPQCMIYSAQFHITLVGKGHLYT